MPASSRTLSREHVFVGAPADGLALRETDPAPAELAALLAGVKPAVCAQFEESEFGYIETVCRRLGFFWEATKQAPLAETGFRRTIFIARERASLKNLASLPKSTTAARWGKLLGYPACCVKLHSEALNRCRREQKAGRPADEEAIRWAAANSDLSGPLDFVLNNTFNYIARNRWNDLQRDKDGYQSIRELNREMHLNSLAVITWHPCSYQCAPSIKAGRAIFAYLAQHLPSLAAKIKCCLAKPVLFYDKYEFLVLNAGRRTADAVFFDGISAPISLISREASREIARMPSLSRTKPLTPGPFLLDFAP